MTTKKTDPQTYEVPADVIAHLETAIMSWRAASAALTAHVESLTDGRRQTELKRVIRALNSQALLLEQVVIATPGS